jgi:hypothetical protein
MAGGRRGRTLKDAEGRKKMNSIVSYSYIFQRYSAVEKIEDYKPRITRISTDNVR